MSLPAVIFPGICFLSPSEKLVGSPSHLYSFLFTYEDSLLSAAFPTYLLSKTCQFYSKAPLKVLKVPSPLWCSAAEPVAHIPGGRLSHGKMAASLSDPGPLEGVLQGE